MKKNPWLMLFVLLIVFAGLWGVLLWTSTSSIINVGFAGGSAKKNNFSVSRKDAILHLKIEGVIVDGRKFLEPLLEHKEDSRVKAVVIEINSPGGVVGPSQEIYEEIRRVREDLKKPVVAVSTGLMASGAYYAAVAADKIMVQPGTLVGSIGVIMEFTNLEKLYDWAKISRYSINTGKYKDSGAEYREMREDERAVFQSLVDDVLGQFVEAVATGRNMKTEQAQGLADGRVFTGRQAKELGMVDVIGTREDAFELAAELAGLKDDKWEIFEPKDEQPGWMKFFASEDVNEVTFEKAIQSGVDRVLKTQLNNRPLFLMPGAL